MQAQTFSFSTALEYLKQGGCVTRFGWNNPNIIVKAQFPDANSKMSKPYLYMEKLVIQGEVQKLESFPLELSCESIFAEDWIECNQIKGEGAL